MELEAFIARMSGPLVGSLALVVGDRARAGRSPTGGAPPAPPEPARAATGLWEDAGEPSARFVRGRDVELEAFIARMSGPLVGSLALVVGDRAVAEELAQEALAKAAVRWSTLSTYDRPEAWVYRVALNQSRSWYRRRAAERRALRRLAGERPTPAHGPDAVAVAVAVREAVAALPERQRQVIACRFYADLDVAGTAAAMGCAEGTVKSLTSKAVAALRAAGLVEEVPGA